MSDYNRDRYGYRNQNDDRSDDPASRWRRGEDRYRREASGSQGEGRFGENRWDSDSWSGDRSDRNRDFGYGRAYRDDDYGGRGSIGGGYGGGQDDWRQQQRTHGQRSSYGSRDEDRRAPHWHEQDREHRAGHPYSGTYGGTGDSSYFTGTQGSWAVGEPRRSSSTSYAGQSYGADYRRHGYDSDNDDRRGFWDRASDEVASWFGDEDAARRRDQDHRGRGPQGYTRSDERIREDANDRLTEDWRVDASNVTVTVSSGEITLDGTVTSREAKRRAEDVVEDVSGVKHVQNNLRVQTSQSGSAYTGNWATNTTSTAEGGTLSRDSTSTQAAKQSDKV
jgi:osmotically-inducible protein OsmY